MNQIGSDGPGGVTGAAAGAGHQNAATNTRASLSLHQVVPHHAHILMFEEMDTEFLPVPNADDGQQISRQHLERSRVRL